MSDWVDAERHAELAHQYYEAGQWDRAAEELRQALSVNPDQSEWQFGLGMTLDALQRYEEAIGAYREVLRLRGDDLDTLLHLGVDQIRVGKAEQAVEALQRAAQADPSAESPYCHRIAAYTQLEDHDSAELMFYLARDFSDECPLCYDHIAHSLAMRGNLDRAAWCWQRTAGLDPQYPGVQVNLARIHWHSGQLQRARQYYLEQVRMDPGDVETLLELGNLLVALNRPIEAGEKFRRVLELEPGVVEAHLRLGQLALLNDNIDAAAKRFERARGLDRQHPGVHLGLAQVAYQRGNVSRARHQLKLELKSGGQNPDQLIEVARLMVELDQQQKAIDLINPWLESSEKSPLQDAADRSAVLVCRGVARLQMGEREAGIVDLRRAADLDPERILPLENLVLAYARSGRLNRAGACLRRARRLKPSDPHLRHLTFRLSYRRLKQYLLLRRGRLRPARLWRDARTLAVNTRTGFTRAGRPLRPVLATAAHPLRSFRLRPRKHDAERG